MKRIIKRYDSITQVHLDLIAEAFPEGFSDEDLVSMSATDGRRFSCLEVRTEDTIYLFRMDSAMIELLEEELDVDVDVDAGDGDGDLNDDEM